MTNLKVRTFLSAKLLNNRNEVRHLVTCRRCRLKAFCNVIPQSFAKLTVFSKPWDSKYLTWFYFGVVSTQTGA